MPSAALRKATVHNLTQLARGNVSLYAEYLKERTDDCILESEYGFATYRYLDSGATVYIVDIYTTPEARQKGEASKLANAICEEAAKKGATKMIGTVQASAKGSTLSLTALLGYGMALQSVANDVIIMRKEIT